MGLYCGYPNCTCKWNSMICRCGGSRRLHRATRRGECVLERKALGRLAGRAFVCAQGAVTRRCKTIRARTDERLTSYTPRGPSQRNLCSQIRSGHRPICIPPARKHEQTPSLLSCPANHSAVQPATSPPYRAYARWAFRLRIGRMRGGIAYDFF